jgi:hypothetical protein
MSSKYGIDKDRGCCKVALIYLSYINYKKEFIHFNFTYMEIQHLKQ